MQHVELILRWPFVVVECPILLSGADTWNNLNNRENVQYDPKIYLSSVSLHWTYTVKPLSASSMSADLSSSCEVKTVVERRYACMTLYVHACTSFCFCNYSTHCRERVLSEASCRQDAQDDTGDVWMCLRWFGPCVKKTLLAISAELQGKLASITTLSWLLKALRVPDKFKAPNSTSGVDMFPESVTHWWTPARRTESLIRTAVVVCIEASSQDKAHPVTEGITRLHADPHVKM